MWTKARSLRLIGANGAGKTTTMHAISGLLKLTSGEITYDGNLISKMEAHKIVRLGLAQVPEGRRVFSGLTVQQNLSMGAYTRHDGKDAIQSDYDMVFDLLPRLKERRNQPAGTLSGGEQQMLAVGRALMCKPKILLLDEPSMGLSPLLVKEIFKIIRDINRQGVTVLLVEQNAKMALDIANRAYVLETGTIKMEGEATELANNIEVRKSLPWLRITIRQHRAIPPCGRHHSGSCGTASALPKCSIMSGCGTRIVLRGKSPSHSATAAPASVRCFRHWRRSPCSIQYYLRFWLSSCRTSLAVSALRIMRYCHSIRYAPAMNRN